MARNTLIILESDVKALTTMSFHADAKWWASVITAVQLATAQRLLGDPLFRELQEQKATDTLTSANTLLLIELKPGLAWRIYAEALTLNSIRLENIGVRRNKDDHSEEAALSEIKVQRMQADNLADTHLSVFINWLNDNAADYPLYQPDYKPVAIRKSSLYNVRQDH